MNGESIYGVYQQLSARRDAIIEHYVKNKTLKKSDAVTYAHYSQELRAINKRLRTIRNCLPVNPTLMARLDDSASSGMTLIQTPPYNHVQKLSQNRLAESGQK